MLFWGYTLFSSKIPVPQGAAQPAATCCTLWERLMQGMALIMERGEGAGMSTRKVSRAWDLEN